MPHMTGGQALIEALKREGIKTVFGLPGAGQYEATDALYREAQMRYISVRHEQAASYMADGYARATNQIAAVLVVPGPGLFNAAAGMATARAASVPMLVISGGRHHPGRDSDESAWMRPLAKWVGRAERPAAIPAVVGQAVQQLKTGRPQPVAVDIPSAVFAAAEEVELIEPEGRRPVAAAGEGIHRAARDLAAALRPLVWAGAGVHRAAAGGALEALVDQLQAPVVSTRQGKGALSDRHPLSLGLAELRYRPLGEWVGQSDLILVVGTSAEMPAGQRSVIRLDVDPAAIRTGELGLIGDARLSLEALGSQVAALELAPPSRVAAVQALNRERFAPAGQLQPQWDLMTAIRAAVPDDGILVQGMNQMGYYSRNYYPVYAPCSYLTPSSQITLGSAYPLALGAKLAAPHRAVVALCGDGGFLYNVQELATAVQYGINAVAVVFNNGAYGNVLRAQLEQFGGRVIGTRLHNPDFAALAHSFGVGAEIADGAAQLERALRRALASQAPALIEVPVGMMEREF